MAIGYVNIIKTNNESTVLVKNNDISPILVGDAVSFSPFDSLVNGVVLANSTLETTREVFGISIDNIPVGESGTVITFGLISNLDTSSFSPGDKLYLGATGGEITNVLPESPNFKTFIGYCITSSTSGQIFIKPAPIDVDVMSFATGYTVTDAETTGEQFWDADNHTMSIVLENGVKGQLFQEQHIYGKNVSGAIIENGSAVSLNDVGGSFNTFEKTDVSDADSAKGFIGIATQDIGINEFGYVTTFGLVRDLNTLSFTEGHVLYVSCTTAGALTESLPNPDCYVVRVGVVDYAHGSHGRINVVPVVYPKLEDLSGVDGTPLTRSGQVPTWDNDNGYFDFDHNLNDYFSYSGFENRTDSSLAVDGSGNFTISPGVDGYVVYINGIGKQTITTSKSVAITADQTITYVYLNSSLTLSKSTSILDFASGANVPVAIVFKDGSVYRITDERHSYQRNRIWHAWAHNNIGAMYKYGFTGTFTNDAISVTQGIIYDEDIAFDSGGTVTSCALWYRNGASGMRLIAPSSTPYYAVGGVMRYDDNSGTLQPVTSNRYTTLWVYATNDSTNPIYTVIGQNNVVNLNDARNATMPVINLSTAEWKLIYRIIYRQVGTTPTFIEAADFRAVQTGVPTSASTTDHNTLINRDATNAHPSSAISYDNSTGGLSAVNAQTAITELAVEKIGKATNVTAINDSGIADGEIAVFNLTNKDIRTSNVTITTTLGADDTSVPTSKAVSDVVGDIATALDVIVGV